MALPDTLPRHLHQAEVTHRECLGTGPVASKVLPKLVEHAIAKMPLAWDQDEEIELNLLPVEEAFALARSGGITHSLTLNALFLFEPLWNQRGKSN